MVHNMKRFSNQKPQMICCCDANNCNGEVKHCVWLQQCCCLDWHFSCECAVLFLPWQTHFDETKIAKIVLFDNTAYQLINQSSLFLVTGRDLYFSQNFGGEGWGEEWKYLQQVITLIFLWWFLLYYEWVSS